MRSWYSMKGYRKNPLHVEPHFKDSFFGHDALLDELHYRVDAGCMVFVEGTIGKTALLMQLIRAYKGKHRIAYVNGETVRGEPDIRILLANGKHGLRTKLFGMPKRMIVLLDNISQLSEENAEKIKYYFDTGDIHALVMTGTSYAEALLPESIRHRIGKRVYALRELTKDEQVDIILERLQFPEYIHPRHIESIAKKTASLKDLIEECNALFFLMTNERMEEVDDMLVKKILQKK